jgi:HK97 family phage prohead protease
MSSRKSLDPDSNLLALVADGPAGTVIGRFSVFNVIDGMGDRTMPGCFDKAIEHLKRNGIKLPLLYHHQVTKGEALIGVVDDLWTDKNGAWFKARLDLSNPLAQRLYALMQIEPTAMGVSMGYGQPKDGSGEKKARDGATNLVEVFPLLEISLTTTPALDVARVEAVKNHGRALTKAENLLLQLDAIAARGGFQSTDPMYVWDGMTNDSVWQWDRLAAEMDEKAATWEVKNNTRPVTTVPGNSKVTNADRARAKRMLADLKKGMARAERQREIADLVKFSNATARPSKSEMQRTLDSFDAVLTPKGTPTDIESLFGEAPPIPKEKLQ